MPETLSPPLLEPRTMLAPLYRVLLHNDEVNMMDDVVHALVLVFAMKRAEAIALMLEAHSNGVAVCATEPADRAEQHRDGLRSLGLIATIEPDD